MKIGVLALQGAFARHATVLSAVGAAPLEVRRPEDLAQVDALVVPGGESTTMSMLLEASGLFETEVAVEEIGAPFHGVFIRAPLVERVGPGVEVLAEGDGHAVLCREGNVLVSSFHPELAGDDRIHRWFVESAAAGPDPVPEG